MGKRGETPRASGELGGGGGGPGRGTLEARPGTSSAGVEGGLCGGQSPGERVEGQARRGGKGQREG